MSKPSKGDPQIDVDVESGLLVQLEAFNKSTANNLSYDLICRLQNHLNRVESIVINQRVVLETKKKGGHKGAKRAKQARRRNSA